MINYLATFWSIDNKWSEDIEFETFNSAFIYLSDKIKEEKNYKLAELSRIHDGEQNLVLSMRSIK